MSSATNLELQRFTKVSLNPKGLGLVDRDSISPDNVYIIYKIRTPVPSHPTLAQGVVVVRNNIGIQVLKVGLNDDVFE